MTKPNRDEGLAAMVAERIVGSVVFEINRAYWCVECKKWWFTEEESGDNVREWTCSPCDLGNTGTIRGPEYIKALP